MPKISNSDLKKMRGAYDHEVARHLVDIARNRSTITYAQLAALFGRTARNWGDPLGGIALRCNDAHVPLLPVLVVTAATRMPSSGAVLYKDLGLDDEAAIRREQQNCYDFDWSKTPLGK
ncbi:MAG: hypothetical protein WD017_08385 [Cucumibacter sp.]